MGEEVMAREFTIALGGGPMVAAIVLDKLGRRTKLGTFLGQDVQSRLCQEMLKENNYFNYHVFPTSSLHPIAITSVITSSAERGFISFNQRADEQGMSPALVESFLKGSRVCFCPNDLAIAAKLKADGAILVYDVGWDDNLSIKGIKEYLMISDYFTPNEKEATKMCGTDDIKQCLDILQKYLKTPIIKLGDKGSICKIDDEYYLVPPAGQFNVVDTTGAGDNYLAGLIYGILNNVSLLDCLKYANILAGISCEVLGCYNANISVEQIQKYFDEFPEVLVV